MSNLTKEWFRVVLEIGVGYEEDVDRVIAVLAEVGQSLTEDERFGTLVFEPPPGAGGRGPDRLLGHHPDARQDRPVQAMGRGP